MTTELTKENPEYLIAYAKSVSRKRRDRIFSFYTQVYNEKLQSEILQAIEKKHQENPNIISEGESYFTTYEHIIYNYASK